MKLKILSPFSSRKNEIMLVYGVPVKISNAGAGIEHCGWCWFGSVAVVKTEQGTTRVRILCVLAAYFHLCAINFPLWPAFMLCVCVKAASMSFALENKHKQSRENIEKT